MDKFLQAFLEKYIDKYDFIENLNNRTYLLKNKKTDEEYILKSLIKKEKYPGSIEMFEKRFSDIMYVGITIVIKYEEIGIANKQFYKLYKKKNKTLEEYLAENQLTAKDAVSLFENLLKCIILLHNNKIVHGNLKPSNIIIQENGYFQFTDFSFENDSIKSHYQLENVKDYPAVLSDIYAIGIIFYEMLNWESAQNGIKQNLHIPGNLYLVIEKICCEIHKKHFTNASDIIDYLEFCYGTTLETLKDKNIPEKKIESKKDKIELKQKSKAVLLYIMLYMLVVLIILYLYLKK